VPALLVVKRIVFQIKLFLLLEEYFNQRQL